MTENVFQNLLREREGRERERGRRKGEREEKGREGGERERGGK